VRAEQVLCCDVRVPPSSGSDFFGALAIIKIDSDLIRNPNMSANSLEKFLQKTCCRAIEIIVFPVAIMR